MLDHPRKQIRLRGYNYSSPGWYYITICTYKRRLFLGEIKNKKMELNEYGKIIKDELIKTPLLRQNVFLDIFQIMPNHVHLVMRITAGAYCHTPLPTNRGNEKVNSQHFRSPSKNLGATIRGFKSSVTKKICQIIGNPQFPVWQRSYYDHIIRSEKSLGKIRQYIQLNPLLWDCDRNNPNNFKS